MAASGLETPKLAGTSDLVEFCQDCETIELWFYLAPNDQMQLVWLLDYFRSYPEIVARLKLRIVDFELVVASGEELDRWKVRGFDVDCR